MKTERERGLTYHVLMAYLGSRKPGHVFKTMIKHSSLSTQLPEFKGIIRTYVLMINQSSI